MQLLPVIHPGERVLVAVSGGADSICLLRLMQNLQSEGKAVVTAAHLNHGIRGKEADEDEAFVREVCREIGVPLTVGHEDVPALAEKSGLGIETQARVTRRGFLEKVMRADGASVIVTGHHAQDQAETVLMHLLRGSGLKGAGGIKPREGFYARPLLSTGKDEILRWLSENGQPYREDGTNYIADTPRNALRLEIMPRLNGIYPGARDALNRFARIASEADGYLLEQAEAFLKENAQRHPFGSSLRTDSGVHPAVLRRAIVKWTGGCESALAERLMLLMNREKGVEESGGVRYERSGARLYAIRRAYSAQTVPLADGAVVPGLGKMRIFPWTQGVIRNNPYVQVLDESALKDACIRTRRPGDRMRPLGASGTRKLSDILTDKKVDRPMRDVIPLVARDETVLWAVGICVSQQASITDNTRRKVRLEWTEEDEYHE